MESCNNCKYWKKYTITDLDRKTMEFYRSKLENVKYTSYYSSFFYDLMLLESRQYKGDCRRFPTHVETREDHGCGEFKYENL